jgi:hypothetical protein
MTTQASFQIDNGQRLLKASDSRAVIVHRWFGMKSTKSKKSTWNETLVVSGPRKWVLGQWEVMKANYGA